MFKLLTIWIPLLNVGIGIPLDGRRRVHCEINKLRKLHGGNPLSFGGSISGRASKFARDNLPDFLNQAIYSPIVDGSFVHETDVDNLGVTVNILPGSVDEYAAFHSTLNHIRRHQKYDWSHPEEEKTEATLAFTQMLWLNTTEIDYSFIQVNEPDVNGRVNTITTVVLVYSPRGNIPGKFELNVNPREATSMITTAHPAKEPTSLQCWNFWISSTFFTFLHEYRQCGLICNLKHFWNLNF